MSIENCKFMVSAIVLIGKRSQLTLIVRAEDWLNPDMYIIDGQDPYTGETHVIYKHMYKIGWIIDENGDRISLFDRRELYNTMQI